MRNNDTLMAEELQVSVYLHTLRLSKMADAFEKKILNPDSYLLFFLGCFNRIVSEERNSRYNKKFNKLLR